MAHLGDTLENMGRKGIGVSGLALTVSRAIRAQVGMRRMNQSELARQIGRSGTYVRERINDEKEWAIGDLEKICDLWHMTPGQLINSVPDTDDDPAPVDDDVEARVAETKRLLAEDPLQLAASHDDLKDAYIQYGDGTNA